MLAFSDFRDIPRPLRVKKKAKIEPHAELFAAFPYAETLFFTVLIDRAFLTSEVSLRFCSDDDGRVISIPLQKTEDTAAEADVFSASVPMSLLCGESDNGLFWYHVEAQTVYGRLYSHGDDACEEAWLSDKIEYATPYQLTVYRDDYTTPDYLGSGVMYQIFVDRFFRGGNAPPRKDVVMASSWDQEISQFPAYPGAPLANDLFYGGDLDGVRKKLPYLQSLGVTVLYLCPIFEAASNHKYDTGDYREVDAMFGGHAALDRLLRAAEERGIKVILDGVFNHTGSDSRYFNRFSRYDSVGAYQSTDSPYYHWYRFADWPNEYICWWGVTILPTVNSSDPGFIDFIAGEDGVVADYCQKGVAGFRLDVADELSPALICAIRERLHKISPNAALIGEVWEDASNKIAYNTRRRYFRGEQLDAVMNYPLKNAIISYLLNGDAQNFAHVSTTLYAHYPRVTSEAMMNLLGTHDTERILTVLSGKSMEGLTYAEMRDIRLGQGERRLAAERLRLAYALLAFMPGIPCIYYGDEVGMEGAKDPFNRRTYPWGHEDLDILAFYRTIGQMRQKYRSLMAHGYFRVPVADGDLLVLERFTDVERMILLVNRGDREHPHFLHGDHTDVLSIEKVTGDVMLEPRSFLLLHTKF